MPDEEKDSMDRLVQAAVDAGDFQYAGMAAAADAFGLKMNDPKVVAALSQIKSRAAFDEALDRVGSTFERCNEDARKRQRKQS